MDVGLTYFQSDKNDQLIVRDATTQDNHQLLTLVAETMPSNGMILSFERGDNYFKATYAQYHQPEIKVVVEKHQPDVIIGMMNIGFKHCYINEQLTQIRYVSDLRINPSFRGKKVVEVLMDYLYRQVPLDSFLQSVVLEDNQKARHMLHQSRPHFPEPYIFDQITTYNISKASDSKSFEQFSMRILTKDLIAIANQFIGQMKQYYNFLSAYDFHDLFTGEHPFWVGMRPEDFILIFDANQQLVGILGLWNQKSFKQTKALEYSPSLKYLRPFYNVYAYLTQQIMLPQIGQSFDYLMSHSVLCEPSRLDVFAYQLYLLNVETKKSGKSSFCITLSDDDPRSVIAKQSRSHQMHATHTLHSFQNSPIGQFDRSKISYFEVGRL